MALREKFGKLVLLEETDASALGRESRAARLGPAGLDRLVSVLRLSPAISAHAEATKRLVDEARLAARLQIPGLVRVLGIGRVEQSFYVSSEPVEGRSLATVLARCREEAFPFATDHALTIASRVAQALGSLHGKKDDAGTPIVHGLLAPSRIMVAFDGEVKVKGLGLWRALAGTDLLPEEERRYLAPEQAAGGPGEPPSDVYTLGRILLETLTGQAPDGSDPLRALATAQVTSTVGERGPLPGPLAQVLRRALDPEPASRFPRMADMGKALDALLFSGDFAPTTFDLAFFMHTLFRDQMEQEAQALDEALRADYGEFLVAETPAAPAAPAAAPPPPSTATTAVPPPTQVEALRPTEPEPPAPPRAGLGPDASGARAAASRASREASAREAAARMTLGSIPAPPPGRRGLWLLLGLLGAVAAGGGAGWLYFVKLRVPASPPTTLSPEAAAAQERVRELEARIVQLEREKGEAEAKAAEDARKSLEAKAAARGGPADPAAVQQAQEEARRRARAEQDRMQLEERRRLEDQKKAEEKRLAEASPSPAPAPTLTPTPTPEPPPVAAVEPPAATAPSTTLPAAATPLAGTAPAASGRPTDPSDPAVRPPVLVSDGTSPYPPRAVGRRISTTVVVRALVDEKGQVAEASIAQSSGQPAEYGFDEAALKRVRGRRYRPARRNDVPVPMWVMVRVEFQPPPPRPF